MRTVDYSTYLSRVSGLIGVAVSTLQDPERFILNGFFNHAITVAWESSNWLDLTHLSEARFAGNLIPYANAYTANGSSWVTTGVTVADNALPNPADSRVTAAHMFETAVNSEHSIATPAISVIPNTDYIFSAYLAPAGRNFVRLQVAVGASIFNAFLDLTNAGAVVSQSNAVAGVGQVAGGFYKCTLTFKTPNTTPLSAAASISLSNDGATTAYLGDGVSGINQWGLFLGQSNSPSGSLVIPWVQTGETEIEALFQIWKSPSGLVNYPAAIPYNLTIEGAQIIGPGSAWNTGTPSAAAGMNQGNPVYVDYREPHPNYEGSDFSLILTYTPGEQVYFTTNAGAGNYYRCLAPTLIAESPTIAPAKWAVIPVPRVFLDYTVYNAYAQWLRVEGQSASASIAEQRADFELAQQFDRQERQMGAILPTKYQTHVSTQPR